VFVQQPSWRGIFAHRVRSDRPRIPRTDRPLTPARGPLKGTVLTRPRCLAVTEVVGLRLLDGRVELHRLAADLHPVLIALVPAGRSWC